MYISNWFQVSFGNYTYPIMQDFLRAAESQGFPVTDDLQDLVTGHGAERKSSRPRKTCTGREICLLFASVARSATLRFTLSSVANSCRLLCFLTSHPGLASTILIQFSPCL